MDKFDTGIYMDKLQYKIYHENKTHTPDDFPYNTYLCSIPLDFQSVNLHWHDEVEIIVIKKGIGIVSVDLTTYSVSAGDIIFVLPGQLHSISQKDNEIMEYENILFQSSLLYSADSDPRTVGYFQPYFSRIHQHILSILSFFQHPLELLL